MATQERAVLGIKKRSAPSVLAGGKAIYNGLLTHPQIFTACNPPLPELLAQIQALDSAQQAAATRGKGLVAVRNKASADLCASLESECTYVRTLAIASPEQAATIILAAGMKVATFARHTKPVVGATLGSSPQSVVVRANITALLGAAQARSKHRFFSWAHTEDGGKTWSAPTQTNLPTTTFTNLTPLVVHGFRVAVTVGTVTQPWTDMVTILVP